MGEDIQPAKAYIDGKCICTMYPGQLQTVNAAEQPESAPKRAQLNRTQSFTFTTKSVIILPKKIRRIPICKSRKRFIKKLMALGLERNRAAAVADVIKRFDGGLSYQRLYYVTFNTLNSVSELMKGRFCNDRTRKL